MRVRGILNVSEDISKDRMRTLKFALSPLAVTQKSRRRSTCIKGDGDRCATFLQYTE